jgi:tetratricopeptide (TPR) repeat protein
MTLNRLTVLLLLLISFPTLAQNAPPAPPDPDEVEVAKLIDSAANLLQHGQAQNALTQAIDPAVAKADAKMASESRKVYTARTAAESLLYLVQSANDKRGSAVVWNLVWSQPYFLKGYLLNELGKPSEARAFIERALDMAPMNAQYLTEMGNLENKSRNWDAGMAIFRKAEEAANAFSPDNLKIGDLGKALRGQGFILVELNKFDEAEAIYRRCLSIDPNDKRAAGELQYVLAQKAKRTAPVNP